MFKVINVELKVEGAKLVERINELSDGLNFGDLVITHPNGRVCRLETVSHCLDLEREMVCVFLDEQYDLNEFVGNEMNELGVMNYQLFGEFESDVSSDFCFGDAFLVSDGDDELLPVSVGADGYNLRQAERISHIWCRDNTVGKIPNGFEVEVLDEQLDARVRGHVFTLAMAIYNCINLISIQGFGRVIKVAGLNRIELLGLLKE